MRKVFGGTVAAFATSISMVALSGCSVSLVDAQSSSDRATVGDRAEKSDGAGMANGGQPHDPKGDDGPRGSSSGSGAGAGEGADSSKEKSFGESGANNKGTPAGEGARPAGHEGLWFDSEPEDPWDKYVWKSQKYIGKGGEIPKLGPGTADKAFWGLPDLCSKKMQQRMKDVGFEFAEGAFKDPGMHGCWFLEVGTSAFSLRSQSLIMYSTEDKHFKEFRVRQDFPAPSGKQRFVHLTADIGVHSCGVVRPFVNKVHLDVLPVEKEDEVELNEICRRATAYSQIVDNIVNQ